jgi:aryl-alcohol dehydrogenase-like predicted oxidoreductase
VRTSVIAPGVTVSQAGLGAMTFGDQLDLDEAKSLARLDRDAGVNFLDTANVYAAGRSEALVGEIIKGIRDWFVLATKAGIPTSADDNRPLSAESVRRASEASLGRLQTDRIDLYYLYQPDWSTPIDETLEAMRDLVAKGLVRAVGVSNYPPWQIAEMRVKAEATGLPLVSVAQQQYNLLSRRLEEEYSAFARSRDVATVVYNPLAGGLLTGKHREATSPSEDGRFSSTYRDHYWNREQLEAVEDLGRLADARGLTLTELSLRWLLSNDLVSVVLLGASRRAQLVENLAAVSEDPLDPEAYEVCDSVWSKLRGAASAYNR